MMGIDSSSQTTPVTSQLGDRLTHQILDLHVDPDSTGGFLRTMCGQWIIPAPMMSKLENPCPTCTWMIAPDTQRTVPPRTPRRLTTMRARLQI
jgi:hypothetical protein